MSSFLSNVLLTVSVLCFSGVSNHIIAQTTKPVATTSSSSFKKGKALFDKKQYSEAFNLFKQAASEGDSNGYYYMGLCYQRGVGVDIKPYQAYSLCKKAADMGNPDALFWMWKACVDLYVTDETATTGVNYLKKAADAGCIDACEIYAQRLSSGTSFLTKDLDKAKVYFDKAVKGGCVDAYCTLAQYHYFGTHGYEKDPVKVKYYTDKLKACNTARAYNQLAYMYEDGSIGEKNIEKARELHKKAAEMGDSDSAMWLGNYVYWNKGDSDVFLKWWNKSIELGCFYAYWQIRTYFVEKKDYVNAIEYLLKCGAITKAYDKDLLDKLSSSDRVKFLKRIVDNPPVNYSFLGEAYNWIGNHYYRGDGVTQSYAEAVNWYKKGAGQGNGWACYNLASAYFKGQGIEKNYNQGFIWMKKASDKGLDVGVDRDLAYCYYNGYGTNVNRSESFRLFKKCAEKNDAESQYMLALHYIKGYGTSVDQSKCVGWLEKSANNGFEPAKKQLKDFKSAQQNNNPYSAILGSAFASAMANASSEIAYNNYMSEISNSATATLNSINQMNQEIIASAPNVDLVNAIPPVDNGYDNNSSSVSSSNMGQLVGTYSAYGLSHGFGNDIVQHNQSFQVYKDGSGYYIQGAHGVNRYLRRNTFSEFLGYNVSRYNYVAGVDTYWFFSLPGM